MEEAIIRNTQDVSTTQSLESRVLGYAPSRERFLSRERFFEDTANESLDFFITSWYLQPIIQVQQRQQEEIFREGKNIETEDWRLNQIKVIQQAKQWYELHKEQILKKYKGKYIAILNNKVVGSDKDFSKLAERMYKKFGYQTIYMPFVSAQRRIVRIPSPRVKNF